MMIYVLYVDVVLPGLCEQEGNTDIRAIRLGTFDKLRRCLDATTRTIPTALATTFARNFIIAECVTLRAEEALGALATGLTRPIWHAFTDSSSWRTPAIVVAQLARPCKVLTRLAVETTLADLAILSVISELARTRAR